MFSRIYVLPYVLILMVKRMTSLRGGCMLPKSWQKYVGRNTGRFARQVLQGSMVPSLNVSPPSHLTPQRAIDMSSKESCVTVLRRSQTA